MIVWPSDAHRPDRPGADTQALAFTLIGGVHHLVITNPGGAPELTARVRRIVAVLLAGTSPASG